MFIRRNTDQTYTSILKLMAELRENFQEREIHLKLLRRFWKCLQAYKDGQSYAEVMKMFFSSSCTGNVKSYTRIMTKRKLINEYGYKILLTKS